MIVNFYFVDGSFDSHELEEDQINLSRSKLIEEFLGDDHGPPVKGVEIVINGVSIYPKDD